MLMATTPWKILALTDELVQQLLTVYAFVERTYQHERLRIKYVSGDLCVHAVGLLLTELLEGHYRSTFEVYDYDYSPEDGPLDRKRLKEACDLLRFIHKLTDLQFAEQVLFDEIDTLIYLHGLNSDSRPSIFSLHIVASTNTPVISLFTSAHHDFRKPLDCVEKTTLKEFTINIANFRYQKRYAPKITAVIFDQGHPLNKYSMF